MVPPPKCFVLLVVFVILLLVANAAEQVHESHNDQDIDNSNNDNNNNNDDGRDENMKLNSTSPNRTRKRPRKHLTEKDLIIHELIIDSYCYDTRSSCAAWAMAGECELNAKWMHSHCPKSCHTCRNVIQYQPKTNAFNPIQRKYKFKIESAAGAQIGVPQVFSSAAKGKTEADEQRQQKEQALLDRIHNATEYIQNVVMKQERYKPVRDVCHNTHRQCTQWALLGYCRTFQYMKTECAPVCFTCETLWDYY